MAPHHLAQLTFDGAVLGTYDIDENGDTTLSDYGGYKVEGGKLVFNKVIKAQAG